MTPTLEALARALAGEPVEAAGIFADEGSRAVLIGLLARLFPPVAALAFAPPRSLVAITAADVVAVRVRVGGDGTWRRRGPVRRWPRSEVAVGAGPLTIQPPGEPILSGEHPYEAAARVVRCLQARPE